MPLGASTTLGCHRSETAPRGGGGGLAGVCGEAMQSADQGGAHHCAEDGRTEEEASDPRSRRMAQVSRAQETQAEEAAAGQGLHEYHQTAVKLLAEGGLERVGVAFAQPRGAPERVVPQLKPQHCRAKVLRWALILTRL